MDLKIVIYVLPLSWKVNEKKSDFFLFAVFQLLRLFSLLSVDVWNMLDSLIFSFNGKLKIKFD